MLVECASQHDVLQLSGELRRRPLAGQEDVVSAEGSVLVMFATSAFARDAWPVLRQLTAEDAAAETPRELSVDVIYDGPDLDTVAQLTGLSRAAVVRAHAEATWTVAFLGFAPGFAYLVADHERLRVPRRAEPWTRVPAGSVALGGPYSAVYPRDSPGGWQLIGRSPVVMWDLDGHPPSLVGPGDRVRFRPVRETIFPQVAATQPASASPAGAVATAVGPALAVVRPGFSATIQDAGRRGLGHIGVGHSGALDVGSLTEANWLVGNGPGAAGIEITPGGFACTAVGDLVIAVTGARVPLTITEPVPRGGEGEDEDAHAGQRPAPLCTPFLLREGEMLSFGIPSSGFRSYLAVRGGLAVPPVLGSRSTDTLSRLGPQPLRGGSVIPAGAEQADDVQYAAAAPEVLAPPGPTVLQVTLGPRDDLFSPAAVSAFLASTWTVGSASDRVGLRLAGTGSAAMAHDIELPSEGMAGGSVQVPQAGNPILFLSDHPVTGGYPVIAVVEPCALRLAAQLAPGDQLVFALAGAADAADANEPDVGAAAAAVVAGRADEVSLD